MADELRYTCVSSYTDDDGVDLPNFGILDLNVDVSTKRVSEGTISVGTSEELIPLGEVTAAGAMITVVNYDDSNYVSILASTGGTNIVKIPAGEGCMFRFGSGITAPYFLANTAACKVRFRLVNA